MKQAIKIILTLLLYLCVAYVVMVLVYNSGIYPYGSDTMFHVYRANVLYHSIQEGNWFPLIDPIWYNGAELLRYWAPFPVYIMTVCQFLAGGNLFDGYLLFVGGICLFNAVPWLFVGISRKRIGLGAFLGALWFFMPNNLYALFGEGNLARSICMIFLPLFVHYLIGFLQDKKRSYLLKLMITTFFMALCHLGYAGMIFLTVVIYLICHAVLWKEVKYAFQVVIGMASAFLWTGLWTVASLQGGITSTDSSQVMAGFFQDAFLSLNPFYRQEQGQIAFYFGLAAFILAVFGLLFSYKKSRAAFLCALIIFICTTSSAYPILSKLPGSQYLWMLRFISIALCFILYGFLAWDTLKKPLQLILCVLLVLDVVPSLPLVCGNSNGIPVEERMEELSSNTLIRQAKKITTQRLALLDESTLGATGAYLTSAFQTTTAITFGAGWQGANTATNIAALNEALDTGKYVYLFDRCLELGNDTVLIKTALLQYKEYDIESVDRAAETVGYYLVEANDEYRLYHIETAYASFGIVTQYTGVAIGTSAIPFTLLYPQVTTGKSDDLNDYSFEELSEYQLIYLDGFDYSNRVAAEELILKLSEAGVRVVISADGIPVNEHNELQQFLGVNCYKIRFNNGYPLIDTYQMGRLDLDLFPSGYTDWSTVYLEGLDECYAYVEDKGEQLEFFGTVHNENIIFIGLNLTYHCALTDDAYGIQLLSHAMGSQITAHIPPVRELVPVTIVHEKNKIRITTEQNFVNTTLAYHENSYSNQPIWEENNLLYVNAGVTELELFYPYFSEGLFVTIAGIALSMVLWIISNPNVQKRKNKVSAGKEGLPMIQKEYQFNFFLNASHSMNINGVQGHRHSHTWEIALTIQPVDESIIRFNEIEREIEAYLSSYQEKYLNETPPFDCISPILENIMDYFTKEIGNMLQKNGWMLVKTAISENPTRAYVIEDIITEEIKEQPEESVAEEKREYQEEAAVSVEQEQIFLPVVVEKNKKTNQKEKKTIPELNGNYVIVNLGKKGKRAIHLSLFPSKKKKDRK